VVEQRKLAWCRRSLTQGLSGEVWTRYNALVGPNSSIVEVARYGYGVVAPDERNLRRHVKERLTSGAMRISMGRK
jgi:hypothetical protein